MRARTSSSRKVMSSLETMALSVPMHGAVGLADERKLALQTSTEIFRAQTDMACMRCCHRDDDDCHDDDAATEMIVADHARMSSGNVRCIFACGGVPLTSIAPIRRVRSDLEAKHAERRELLDAAALCKGRVRDLEAAALAADDVTIGSFKFDVAELACRLDGQKSATCRAWFETLNDTR